jgi:hypothetical protein
VEITTTQDVTASAGGGAFDVGLRVANRLGAGVGLVGAGVACGSAVRFELRPAAGLDVKHAPRGLDVGSGGGGGRGGGAEAGLHVFAVQLSEGAGGAEDVPRQLVAVLTRTDGSEVEAAVPLTYIPLAVVQANGQQVSFLAERLAKLRTEASAAERAKKKWESDRAEAARAVQAELAAVNSAPELSPAEKAEAALLQQEQQQQLAAPPTPPECRNPPRPLVLLKRERADLRCVYELGRVEGREDGEAIAAVVGSKMMAVVTSTEAEKEQLIRDPRYEGA